MSWAIGFDDTWNRDIGYGVPANCDHPSCIAKINRGLSYVCGGEPYGGDDGCGLYFCSNHLYLPHVPDLPLCPQLCERCSNGDEEPFKATLDHPQWIEWKLTDGSWQKWRDENPVWVADNE